MPQRYGEGGVGGGGWVEGGSLRTGFDASGNISMFTAAAPLVTVKCALMFHTRALASLLRPGSTTGGWVRLETPLLFSAR